MLLAIFVFSAFLIAALIKENQLKKPYLNVRYELENNPEYYEQNSECVYQLEKIERGLHFCVLGKCFSVVGIFAFSIAYII